MDLAESLYWEQAADSIKKFLELRNSTDARLKMVKLNQAISGLPDNLEDYEAMKPHKKNFSSALRALKEHDESEVASVFSVMSCLFSARMHICFQGDRCGA